MLENKLITSIQYRKNEIPVEEAIKRDAEVLQKTPYGYNAKNWEIKVKFLDEENYRIETFADGEED